MSVSTECRDRVFRLASRQRRLTGRPEPTALSMRDMCVTHVVSSVVRRVVKPLRRSLAAAASSLSIVGDDRDDGNDSRSSAISHSERIWTCDLERSPWISCEGGRRRSDTTAQSRRVTKFNLKILHILRITT